MGAWAGFKRLPMKTAAPTSMIIQACNRLSRLQCLSETTLFKTLIIARWLAQARDKEMQQALGDQILPWHSPAEKW
ncbi:MAG: hypothetical protein ACRYHQ_33830, partial [Janthinobacterium lividum]